MRGVFLNWEFGVRVALLFTENPGTIVRRISGCNLVEESVGLSLRQINVDSIIFNAAKSGWICGSKFQFSIIILCDSKRSSFVVCSLFNMVNNLLVKFQEILWN